MVKNISLILIAAVLTACSINGSHQANKDATAQTEMLNIIRQYQQEDSLKIEQIKHEIVLYRQVLLNEISELEFLSVYDDMANSWPKVQTAAASTEQLRQQAIKYYKEDLSNLIDKLNSVVSDSLFNQSSGYSTISFQKFVNEMDKEVDEVRDFRHKQENKSAAVSSKKEDMGQVLPVQTSSAKIQVPADQTTQLEYDNAKIIYDNGDYDSAVILFRAFLDKYPKHVLAANAQYWLGESYYSNDDYSKAIHEFENLTWKYPNSAKAPDAQFKIGLSYLKQGNKQQAKLELMKVKDQYPNYEQMNQVNDYLLKLK